MGSELLKSDEVGLQRVLDYQKVMRWAAMGYGLLKSDEMALQWVLDWQK